MFSRISDYDEYNQPSIAELDRQEAFEIGEANPDQAWINTNRDAWHANPFYKGMAVPHPEMLDEPEMGVIEINTLIKMLQVQQQKGAKIVKLDGSATLLTDNGNFVLLSNVEQW